MKISLRGVPATSVDGCSLEALAFALTQQRLGSEIEKKAKQGKPNWAPSSEWLLSSYADFITALRAGEPPARQSKPTPAPPRAATSIPGPKRSPKKRPGSRPGR